jgi:hypothetical protein
LETFDATPSAISVSTFFNPGARLIRMNQFKDHFQTNLQPRGALLHKFGLQIVRKSFKASDHKRAQGAVADNQKMVEARKEMVLGAAKTNGADVHFSQGYADVGSFSQVCKVLEGCTNNAMLLGYPTHVVGCGTKDGKSFYVMDPNQGLYKYKTYVAMGDRLDSYFNVRKSKKEAEAYKKYPALKSASKGAKDGDVYDLNSFFSSDIAAELSAFDLEVSKWKVCYAVRFYGRKNL